METDPVLEAMRSAQRTLGWTKAINKRGIVLKFQLRNKVFYFPKLETEI
jgi:hypothetical protein